LEGKITTATDMLAAAKEACKVAAFKDAQKAKADFDVEEAAKA